MYFDVLSRHLAVFYLLQTSRDEAMSLTVFVSFKHAIHLRRANIHTGQKIFTWKYIFITLNYFFMSIFICPSWPCIIFPSCDCLCSPIGPYMPSLLKQPASAAAYASAALSWMQGEYSYSAYLQSPHCMVDLISHSINTITIRRIGPFLAAVYFTELQYLTILHSSVEDVSNPEPLVHPWTQTDLKWTSTMSFFCWITSPWKLKMFPNWV